MIKFTEDQLKIIEIIGYTPKPYIDKNGETQLDIDWFNLKKDKIEQVARFMIEVEKEKLKKALDQMFLDDIVYGESCINLDTLERVHPLEIPKNDI